MFERKKARQTKIQTRNLRVDCGMCATKTSNQQTNKQQPIQQTIRLKSESTLEHSMG